jgi:hypothetical protein
MGRTVTANGTITRPGDTTTYASGDLVANSATAGSVTPVSLTFTLPGTSLVKVRRIHLSKTTNTIAVSSFRVHFFTVSPASANGDNAAFASGTSAGYIGYIDVVAGQGMATGAAGWGAAVEGAEPAAVVAAGSVTLYALVEARASYVPGNAEVITLRAEVEHL